MLDILRGAVLGFGYIPGVRKKRVRLANIPARLGRAQMSKLQRRGLMTAPLLENG